MPKLKFTIDDSNYKIILDSQGFKSFVDKMVQSGTRSQKIVVEFKNFIDKTDLGNYFYDVWFYHYLSISLLEYKSLVGYHLIVLFLIQVFTQYSLISFSCIINLWKIYQPLFLGIINVIKNYFSVNFN